MISRCQRTGRLLLWVLVYGWIWALAFGAWGFPVTAQAEEDWKAEFEKLCTYTDVADTLEPAKLRELVKECDTLMARLSQMDIPQKKPAIFRLQKCRNLFQYVLETKEKGG